MDLATVSVMTVEPTVEFTGSIEAIWQADLSSAVGGRLRDVPVRLGERVASGAVLWTLDDESVRLALQAARAAEITARRRYEDAAAGTRGEEIDRLDALVAQAASLRDQAGRERERFARLYAEGVITPSQWDEVESRYLAALAQASATAAARRGAAAGPTGSQLAVLAAVRDQAMAVVKQVEKQLSDCVVRAPRDGVVVRRLREPGELVGPGEPIVRLLTPRPVKVVFQVGEDQADLARSGAGVRVVTNDAAAPMPGTISAVVPWCDPITRRFPCEAVIAEPTALTFPGRSARVRLSAPAVTGPALPRTALVEMGVRTVVMMVEAGRVRTCEVKVVASDPRVAVIDGVPIGTVVVARGALGLRDGAAVEGRPVAAPTRPAMNPVGSIGAPPPGVGPEPGGSSGSR